MATEFTPPYIYRGLYTREVRQEIEAPNRATIAAIFAQRAVLREELAWQMKRKAMHDSGIHTYGFCPWCPPGRFYD